MASRLSPGSDPNDICGESARISRTDLEELIDLGIYANQTQPRVERFASRVRRHANGCWIWTGSKSNSRTKNGTGYGQFKWNGVLSSPHRFIWMYFNGPIPVGKEIDHVVCRTGICCNPDHLRAVTHKQNQAVLIQETCKRGHNDWRTLKNNKRYCRPCARAAKARFLEQNPGYVPPCLRRPANPKTEQPSLLPAS